jgi:hypothetical protein
MPDLPSDLNAHNQQVIQDFFADHQAKVSRTIPVVARSATAERAGAGLPAQPPIPSMPASSLHLGQIGNRWGSRTGENLKPQSAMIVPPSMAARVISSFRA